jgi:hypothetical protein
MKVTPTIFSKGSSLPKLKLKPFNNNITSHCKVISTLKRFNYFICHQMQTQNFSLGGAGPEAIYNLCLILKIMLQKSCCKYNTTLSATAFIYIRI